MKFMRLHSVLLLISTVLDDCSTTAPTPLLRSHLVKVVVAVVLFATVLARSDDNSFLVPSNSVEQASSCTEHSLGTGRYCTIRATVVWFGPIVVSTWRHLS